MLFCLLTGEKQSVDSAYQSVNSKGYLYFILFKNGIQTFKNIVPKLLWRNLLCRLTMRCLQANPLLHFKLTLSDTREVLKRNSTWGWQAWVNQSGHEAAFVGSCWFLATHLLCSDYMLFQSFCAVCSIFFVGLRIFSMRPEVTKLSFFLKKRNIYLCVS